MFELAEYGLHGDALLLDSSNLMFLSAWGRDTAIQSFVASLSLGESQGGADKFWVQAQSSFQVWVNTQRVEKETGRMPKGSLFGNIAQLWLYDPILAKPDRANRLGYVPYRSGHERASQSRDRVWSLVQSICPIPLLPEWQETVLDEMTDQGWITTVRGICLEAVRVQLPEEKEIADLIRSLLEWKRLAA
jgi:hypothetical protein